MSMIRLSIDTKSLFFNIKNDNERGHTATVATPLKQGSVARPELFEIEKIPEGINCFSKEDLVSQILSKSRASAKINRVCVFEKIAVNGTELSGLPAFCIYIREETDPNNVHFGRQKLHYPMSLCFEDLNVEINNRSVLDAVSEHLHGYAFIVEAFEYCEETELLNFDVTVVGEPDIPYSKVFINRRGVGNKFVSHFHENSDVYDTEIIALREKLGYDAVHPDNFDAVMEENRLKAYQIAMEYLIGIGAQNIRNLKDEYPYSIYDIEYVLADTKRYLVIKHTATKSKYFTLPMSKVQFFHDFESRAQLFLVTDINGEFKTHIYTTDDLNGLNKSINSITYGDRN